MRRLFTVCIATFLCLPSCFTDYSVLDKYEETDVVDETTENVNDTDDVQSDDDVTEDDTIETVEPTGLIGGVVQLGYTYTPCVYCFIGVQQVDSFAAASFHSPQGSSWYDWLPAIGTCSAPYGPNVNPFSYYDVGNSVQLISSPVRNQLTRFIESGKPVYRSGQLGNTGWVDGGDYSLSVGPNSTLGDFEITSIVSAPLPFTHLQPSQMFTSDPTYAFSSVLRRSYTNQFTYVPSGDSDLFILTIDVYDETGSTYLGGVMCTDYDDGSFTMASGLLSPFPPYALSAVTFYKWRIRSGVIASNGATMEGVGQYGVVGTAILQ